MRTKLIFKISIVALALLTVTRVNAEDFELSIDKYYSPYMGADLMMTGLRGYEALDEIILSGSAGDTSLSMCLGRTAKLLIEYSLSNWGMVAQHEVFGHGARAREFHLYDIDYKVDLFHGYTTYDNTQFNQLNINQKAAIAAGGVEATSILAGKMQDSWMEGDAIDRLDAIFYLVNSFDQSMYVFSASDSEFHADLEIGSYIDYVNAWQGGNVLTLNTLKGKIAWDWADPMIYFSLWSLYNYIATGEPSVPFSTLHIGKTRFMPTTRTLLTPWGPEFQLQNHFATQDNKYFAVNFRVGRTGGVNSYGADLNMYPLAQYSNWSLNNKLSAWYQPHIVKNTTAPTNTNKYGFAEFMGVSFNLSGAVKAMGEIGYKTSGYLPGVQLSAGWVWRIGLKFSLDVKPKA